MPSPVKLFSRVIGDAKAPRIIIAHGLCGSGRNWLTAGDALASQGFCVELLDLRDHGQSPWSNNISYPLLADDIVEHWRKENEPPFVFIGHSLGGKTGMVLSTQRKEIFGDKLRGMIVVDIAPKPYTPPYLQALEACRDLDLSKINSRSDADAALKEKIPQERFRQFLLTNLKKNDDGTYSWSCNFGLFVKDLPNVAANPLTPEDKSEIPALFIGGDRSAYVIPDDSPMIKKHFPNSRLEFLQSGHNVHIEAPEDFIRMAVNWIRKLV
jgi:pimeloyl-ACP methyl ester carboxylesterase